MKTDSLTLSPESVAEYLPDCQPGETKTIEVTLEVTTNDEEGLTANVSGVSYTEPEPEAEPEAEPIPMGPEKVAKSKRPAAVLAILGKPSKKK